MAETPERATAERLLEQVGLDATVQLPPRETITGQTLDAAKTQKTRGDDPRPSLQLLGIATLPALDVVLPGSLGAPSVEADLVVRDAIGAGGMGAVYLAEQRSLGREVALKTLRLRSPEAEGALVVEGAITGKLEHPGIPPVHALGRSTDGRPVIVMKRIVGTSWVDLLDDDAHPKWASLRMLPASRLEAHLRILVQETEAVQFAHDQGFVPPRLGSGRRRLLRRERADPPAPGADPVDFGALRAPRVGARGDRDPARQARRGPAHGPLKPTPTLNP